MENHYDFAQIFSATSGVAPHPSLLVTVPAGYKSLVVAHLTIGREQETC
jgi:hypothetical protein